MHRNNTSQVSTGSNVETLEHTSLVICKGRWRLHALQQLLQAVIGYYCKLNLHICNAKECMMLHECPASSV